MTKKRALAVDIGTTTLEAEAFDLVQKKSIGRKSMANPQRRFGPDVVTRLTQVHRKGAMVVRRMQLSVVDGINQLAQSLGGDFDAIFLSGNTTMCGLLLGMQPNGDVTEPYRLDEGTRHFPAAQIGLHGSPGATAYVLPLIGGNVGSDVTAGVWNLGMHRGGTSLLVDIGTNAEIVLAHEGKMWACSTAAGPCFEGASLRCGMRGEPGAITSVDFSQKIAFETVEDEPAKGICGSGILSITRALLASRVVDKTGRMKSREEAEAAGVEAFLCKALQEDGENRRFQITEKVYVTQQDMREVQLAKGAIAAGIFVLLQKANLTASDLDHIYVSGAFGSHSEKESLVAMGLLPDIPLEGITLEGNTSLKGTGRMFLFPEERVEMEQMAAECNAISLAEDESFSDIFVREMNF